MHADIFFLLKIPKSASEGATKVPLRVVDDFYEHYAQFCRYDVDGVPKAVVTQSGQVLNVGWRDPVPFHEGFEAARRKILKSICFYLGLALPQDMSLDKREELLPLVSSIRDKVKEDLFSADFKTIGRACDSIRELGCLIRSLVCNNLLDNNKPMCPFSTDVQDPRIYPAYDLRWFQEVEEPWELGILVADFHM
ncbi:MAG: hypothetical protein ACLQNE_40740 [Thermoguttaceae bacterium]